MVLPNNCQLLDDFNRANGSLGSNWFEVNPGAYALSGNAVLMTASTNGVAIWSPTNFGADQQACVRFTSTVSGSPAYVGLILKASHNSTSPASVIHVDYVSNGTIEVTTYDSSSGFQMWDSASATVNPGDVLGAIAHASGVVDVYVNTTLVRSVDLSGWGYASGGGYIGISGDSLSSSATIDDFGGGSYAAGGGPTSLRANAPTSVLDQLSAWIDDLMALAQNLFGYSAPQAAPSGADQRLERRVL